MAAICFYSFKVSLCLGVLYLFYHLALRNLTYFTWNRWYFLIGSGLSFLIPLVDVFPLLGRQQANPLLQVIPTLEICLARCFPPLMQLILSGSMLY